MTYCAGWKYNNAVFLIADTAATKQDSPTTLKSSFGESHSEVRGEYVEESLLKLVPLGEGVVAAFAGDVQMATACLEYLRENVSGTGELSDLLRSMNASLGPFDRSRPVALLVASSSSDGNCELHRWTSTTCLDSGAGDFYDIGSLQSFHAGLTSEVVALLVRGRIARERLLPIALAVVQSYGIHDNMVEQNVGGVVVGTSTFGGAVQWQPDINYVVYEPTISAPEFISVIARENAILVSSSSTNDTRLFAHSVSIPRSFQWDNRRLQEARRDLDSGQCSVWTFLSSESKVITIIFRSDPTKESKYLQFTNSGRGRFGMALSPELMSFLQQPLQDSGDGSLPFRLNVRGE